MKKCCRCYTRKPESEFNWKVKGKQRNYHCRSCDRAYNNVRYKDHARDKIQQVRNRVVLQRTTFNEWKQTLKCSECSESDFCCLEFHHLDPTQKDASISDMLHRGFSLKNIKAEIGKCVVVCRNCHAKIHYYGRENIQMKSE